MTSTAPLRGPSYPLSYRVFATLAMLSLVAGGWLMRDTLAALEWSPAGLVFVAVAGVVVLVGYARILRSETTVTDDAIEHGWLFTERTEWSEVTHVQLLHWPALAWLVAPRLMVRARGKPNRHRIPLADPLSLQRVRAMVYRPSE
jgi:hypothetical protein